MYSVIIIDNKIEGFVYLIDLFHLQDMAKRIQAHEERKAALLRQKRMEKDAALARQLSQSERPALPETPESPGASADISEYIPYSPFCGVMSARNTGGAVNYHACSVFALVCLSMQSNLNFG